MPTIPPNNNSGLYGISGTNLPINNNVDANNITATGNVEVDGYISAAGNITGNYIIGNGSLLTNINAGNVSGNVANAVHAQYADVANSVSGANVTGTVANATNAAHATVADSANTVAGANVTGQVNSALTAGVVYESYQPAITGLGTLTTLSVTGNVTAASFNTANGAISGGNIDAGNISATGIISATGNVTGGNVVTNGSFVGGNITVYDANVTHVLTTPTANITNVNATTVTATTLSATGNVIGATIRTSGAQGNITGANYISAGYFVGDGSLLTNLPSSSYGNTQVSNYLASGTDTANIITTGNISGSYILGNGSQLTGLPATYSNADVSTYLASGTDTANIITSGNISGGNIIGNGQALTNLPAANIVGTVANASYATNAGHATVADSANAVAGANVTGSVAQATFANVANAVAGGNVSGQVANALVAGTVYTNAQPNITSVGTLSTLSVSGNITSSANISGSYILGNGSQLTGLPATYGNANVAAYLPTYTGNLAGGNLEVGNNAHITNNLTVDGTIYGTFAGNISGNLVVPGSNTQVIYNNNGNAGASANFTFDSATNTVDVNGTMNADIITSTGNISAVGNISGSYILGNGSQLTGLPAGYSNADVSTYLASGSDTANIITTGNVSGGNVLATSNVIANSAVLSTGGRIWGDFTNSTVTNRTLVRTTNTGTSAFTVLGVLPGVNHANAGVGGGFTAYANTDPGNSPAAQLQSTSTDARVVSGRNGTGPYLPLSIQTGGATRMTVDTGGNVGIANTTPQDKLAVTGTAYVSGNIAAGGLLTDGYYYANGTPVTFGGTYGNTEVSAYLASGTDTANIITTGNVSGSYIIGNGSALTSLTGANVTGTVANATYATSAGSATTATTANTVTDAAQANITSVGTLTSLSVSGNIVGGNVSTAGLITATGNVTGGNVIATGKVTSGAVTITGTDGTNGQVLTTYGNGQTYFSTVSGGGGSPGGNTTELQFNNAGSFAGNSAMTFDNTTGNIAFGNLVIGNIGTSGTFYNVLTNKNQFRGNVTTMPSNARILMGSGRNGDWSTTADVNNNARDARFVVSDEYIKADNGVRTTEIASLSFANLNGSTTFGSANTNSRIQGFSSDLVVHSGNTTSTNVGQVRAATIGMLIGTGANTGNANLAHAVGTSSFVTVNAGSTGGNIFGFAGGTTGNGPVTTQVGFAIQLSANANSTGNAYGILMPSNTNTYGVNGSNAARAATNYYFLRNEDSLAKNQLGQINRYYDGAANCGGSSSGAVTINANNGQFQYLAVTEDVTSISFTNFLNYTLNTSSSPVTLADTVTLLVFQDATGRSITMPTSSGSNVYKYAGGVTSVSSTPNSVTLVSITSVLENGTGNNLYLITISPEFS